MSKKGWLIVLALIIILIVMFVILYFYEIGKIRSETEGNHSLSVISNFNVVPSLEDEITENTTWCGTFNLIWNDLKNDLAKQDIVFENQPEIVNNLNKGTFNTSYLSDKSYYKVYGTPSTELKQKIENVIKEKFNETSDILNDFNWDNHGSRNYFLYAMLKKEFEFPRVFTKLDKGTFGEYKNVSYFGINSSTEEAVRDQVKILYYNSKEDFAIKLITKSEDEVIISKGNSQNTFAQIYSAIQTASENYIGDKVFTERDRLQIPNIDFNQKEEFTELENKPFLFSNGEEYEIETAVQTIKFSLDEKGGKIKSEAGIMAKNISILVPEEPREFIVDDTFCIFLKEKDKDLPYFAAKISDILQVQSDVKK